MIEIIKAAKNRVHNKAVKWVRKRKEREKLSIRSHIAHIQVGNMLASISTTGLMAIGVIPMSLNLVLFFAAVLLIAGVVGRYLDAVEDDVERLLKYEEHIRSDSSCNKLDSFRDDCL